MSFWPTLWVTFTTERGGNAAWRTMMTVRDMVSRETPAKNDAAPMRAIAPGSIHCQNASVGTPPWT